MAIKFMARVLLELGAELISSDAVALYELVKNGIDAGSKKIYVKISIAMQPSAVRRLVANWSRRDKHWDLEEFLADARDHVEATATDEMIDEFIRALGRPENIGAALIRLQEAAFDQNTIMVSDSGDGMNRTTLVDCYLTIGTPGRLHEKAALLKTARDEDEDDEDDEDDDNASVVKQVPLGEKGIGRLAAMRLGHYVEVYTGVVGEAHWHVLELDWRPVFTQPDLNADSLDFQPENGARKGNSEKGTDIIIRDLQTDWSSEKIENLWKTDLAKLSDPFVDEYAARFLTVTFQGEPQTSPSPFDKNLLKYADAYCTMKFLTKGQGEFTGQPVLQVNVQYRRYKAAVTASYSGAHLEDVASNILKKKGRAKAADRSAGSDEVVAALTTLGDFEAEFYWFNRGRIQRSEPNLWIRLAPFVNAWSGGLLVYRDGYRVYPYGSGGEDWLDLDRKALASSAFKLNRAQIIGRLTVTSLYNPALKDQTNREGFRDCPEKEALRRMLRQAIISDCRTFLEKIEKSEKILDPDDVGTLDKKIATSSSAATKTLLKIQARFPEEHDNVQQVLAELTEVQDAWKRAKDALIDNRKEMKQYVHLAGVGLSVEFIAHELARSTEHALELLKDRGVTSDPGKLDSLRAQLKTINKRVRIIDELSIPSRQHKKPEDLKELAGVILDAYESKAQRHKIDISVRTSGKPTKVRVERGQMIQILDNLMSNSMYWLQRRMDRRTPPAIDIIIDYDANSLTFSDSGPGIPASIASRVFDAFYTTKPAGDGRGLGLAIARQLAGENGAALELVSPEDGTHRGFELTFKG